MPETEGNIRYSLRLFDPSVAALSSLSRKLGPESLTCRRARDGRLVYTVDLSDVNDEVDLAHELRPFTGNLDFDVFASLHGAFGSHIFEIPRHVVDIIRLENCRSFISYTKLTDE